MKITENLHNVRLAIKANPGGKTDIDIQEQSIKAILGGMKSDDWKTYMSHFNSNEPQLNRLRGLDEPFMKHPTGWGPKILAYIVAGGPCGIGTTLSMPDEMNVLFKKLLDDGLPEDTVASESEPLLPEVRFVVENEEEQRK